MLRLDPRGAVCGICIVVLSLLAGPSRAADATMFDEGLAQRAFNAIQEKVGGKLRVLTLTITPDELRLGIPNAEKPGEVETWRVSHKGLAGALGVDLPIREGSSRASLPGGGTIEESVIDIDGTGLAVVPKLATDALARARFQQPGRVTEMDLMRLPKFLGPAARDPYWQVHAEAPEEDADISFKLSGELKIPDLRRTKRAQNLDLLAGGPDFDELVQNIRNQIKNDWIFHYIEIDKTAINFDVHLLSVKNPRITRFTATLSDIMTNSMSMPRMTFPGEPADDPFSLADVDLSLMTKLEATAKDQLQIADGVVQQVTVSKPHRERGGAIEWVVSVKSAKAPLFTMPGAAPVEEGSVTFDAKGAPLHVKYPPGHGPRTNLFDPVALQKAIDKMVERLGPHVQLSELLISDDTIKITAQDPQDPKKFAVFNYQDEDVSRAAEPFQMVANSMGGGPNWLWDVAMLKPTVVQSLAMLEKQAMARLGGASSKVDLITITKDKQFHPQNEKVLIEIRAIAEGKESQETAFELAGGLAKLDTPASGLRIVGSNARLTTTDQDDEDCNKSLDPAKIIPACTKLAEDANDTPRNRAIAYYDRGNAYKNLKDYDRALSDYSEALKLDPQYAHAYLNRGWVYAAKNDAARSIADSTRAIELDPTEKLAYLDRGLAYRFQRNFDAAIADYSQAIKLGANAGRDYQGRGLAYAGKGDFQSAVGDYNEAIKRGPADAQTLWARADAYRLMNKLDPAIADYDAAIKLDAGYADAYHGRGLAYRKKGDYDRAIADYSEAIKRSPKFAAAYANRGASYRSKGDLDHAVADESQAIELAPKWASPYYLRGFAAYLSGALPKALADMTQANALDPANAYYALMLDIIGQRSKLPSRLNELSAKVDMTAWPAPVIRLYLAQLTPEALIAAADNPDPSIKRGRVCEANFYAGELSALNGRKDDATRQFMLAASDCPHDFDERELAEAELKAMGATAPQAKP